MRLRPATEDEKRARDALTHEAWGQSLTPLQWARREAELRAHPWSRAGMQTWFWCDAPHAGGEPVLASCETFRMESVLRGRPGNAYGVASVYTAPARRGHGHASRMLRAVHQWLGAEDPAAQAMVLYSDVGAPIYGRTGYVERPAFTWSFPPLDGDPAEGVDTLLSERDLADSLARMPRPADPFLIWPSAGQLDWHLARERIYTRELRRPRPVAHGARVGGSFLLWAAAMKADELVILVAGVRAPAELAALLRCARRVAARAGLRSVQHWEVPLPFAAEAEDFGGARVERRGELPMLHPLAPGLVAEDWRTVSRSLWV